MLTRRAFLTSTVAAGAVAAFGLPSFKPAVAEGRLGSWKGFRWIDDVIAANPRAREDLATYGTCVVEYPIDGLPRRVPPSEWTQAWYRSMPPEAKWFRVAGDQEIYGVSPARLGGDLKRGPTEAEMADWV